MATWVVIVAELEELVLVTLDNAPVEIVAVITWSGIRWLLQEKR